MLKQFPVYKVYHDCLGTQLLVQRPHAASGAHPRMPYQAHCYFTQGQVHEILVSSSLSGSLPARVLLSSLFAKRSSAPNRNLLKTSWRLSSFFLVPSTEIEDMLKLSPKEKSSAVSPTRAWMPSRNTSSRKTSTPKEIPIQP